MNQQATRAWIKTTEGDHVQADYCTWKPDEETRMTALWLKFWDWLHKRGRLPEFEWSALCPCGYSIEECPCSFDTQIAHEKE